MKSVFTKLGGLKDEAILMQRCSSIYVKNRILRKLQHKVWMTFAKSGNKNLPY